MSSLLSIAMTYEIVFDARDVVFPHGLALLGAALSCLFGYMVVTLRASRIVRYMGFLLFAAAPAMPVASWLAHSELTDALDQRTASFLEGPVESFEAAKNRRPAMLTVRGRQFCVAFTPRGQGWFDSNRVSLTVGTGVRIWHVHERIARMERQSSARVR